MTTHHQRRFRPCNQFATSHPRAAVPLACVRWRQDAAPGGKAIARQGLRRLLCSVLIVFSVGMDWAVGNALVNVYQQGAAESLDHASTVQVARAGRLPSQRMTKPETWDAAEISLSATDPLEGVSLELAVGPRPAANDALFTLDCPPIDLLADRSTYDFSPVSGAHSLDIAGAGIVQMPTPTFDHASGADLAAAVPEPATWLPLVCGATVLLATAARRRCARVSE